VNQIRFFSNIGQDLLGYLNSESIISMKRSETTECDITNVRVFDTGRELNIRKLGLVNTLIKKEALEADSIRFAYNINVEVNHQEIFNESLNVLEEINNQLEMDEGNFKSSMKTNGIQELRKTNSGLINWTDNQSMMIYILGVLYWL